MQRFASGAALQRQHWRRAERFTQLAQYVPFVRCIIAGGSLALGVARPASDLDLVCLTAARRLWTARLGMSALRLVWGRVRRPPGRPTQDEVGIQTTKPAAKRDIDLVETWSLDGLEAHRQSFYTAALLHHGVVLYDEAATSARYVAANRWIRAYRPGFTAMRRAERPVRPHPAPLVAKRALERLLSGRLGDILEATVFRSWSEHWRRQWPRQEFESGRILATASQACAWGYYWEGQVMERFFERLVALGLQQERQASGGVSSRADSRHVVQLLGGRLRGEPDRPLEH